MEDGLDLLQKLSSFGLDLLQKWVDFGLDLLQKFEKCLVESKKKSIFATDFQNFKICFNEMHYCGLDNGGWRVVESPWLYGGHVK